MFITLTSALEYPDKPLRINIHRIAAFHDAVNEGKRSTRIVLGGSILYVTETPTQIEDLIDAMLLHLAKVHWHGSPL